MGGPQWRENGNGSGSARAKRDSESEPREAACCADVDSVRRDLLDGRGY